MNSKNLWIFIAFLYFRQLSEESYIYVSMKSTGILICCDLGAASDYLDATSEGPMKYFGMEIIAVRFPAQDSPCLCRSHQLRWGHTAWQPLKQEKHAEITRGNCLCLCHLPELIVLCLSCFCTLPSALRTNWVHILAGYKA